MGREIFISRGGKDLYLQITAFRNDTSLALKKLFIGSNGWGEYSKVRQAGLSNECDA